MFDQKIKLIVDVFDFLEVRKSEYASVMFAAIAEKSNRERKSSEGKTKEQQTK